MSSYRSWEEREADAAKARAEAERIAVETQLAQQAVAAGKSRTATDALAEQVKQARLTKQLKAVKDDAADEDKQRKQQRREQRAETGANFRALVNVVMVLGLLAALPAQLSYFLKLHKDGEQGHGSAWLMAPVPFFLELLAWVGVLGTQWAHRKGLPRWPFWILTAGLASVAGYINFAHGAAEYGLIAGVALCATSIIGPVLAEVRQILESKAAADPRGLEQRARDKAAAKKRAAEERAERERIGASDARRKATFPDVFAEYERIIIAHPDGAISRDQAWALAWDNLHRLPLAMTAGTLAARVAAQAGIDAVLADAGRTPESVAVDLLLADIFGPSEGDGGPASGPSGSAPKGGAGGGSGAARTATRDTATTLGGKGRRASERPSGKAAPKPPEKPLAEADLDRVRKLAEALGGADKLSARNVREAVGCRSEYAVRLRDTVQAEEGAKR